MSLSKSIELLCMGLPCDLFRNELFLLASLQNMQEQNLALQVGILCLLMME